MKKYKAYIQLHWGQFRHWALTLGSCGVLLLLGAIMWPWKFTPESFTSLPSQLAAPVALPMATSSLKETSPEQVIQVLMESAWSHGLQWVDEGAYDPFSKKNKKSKSTEKALKWGWKGPMSALYQAWASLSPSVYMPWWIQTWSLTRALKSPNDWVLQVEHGVQEAPAMGELIQGSYVDQAWNDQKWADKEWGAESKASSSLLKGWRYWGWIKSDKVITAWVQTPQETQGWSVGQTVSKSPWKVLRADEQKLELINEHKQIIQLWIDDNNEK